MCAASPSRRPTAVPSVAPPLAKDSNEPPSLVELARVFGTLGLTAFGGPAAHVALMREEFVSRRRWLDDAAFLDLVAATNLIPGPNSTELALHLGHRRRGLAGLVVAGLAFVGPAALLTGLLAWAYVQYGRLPRSVALLQGVKPAMLAVIAHAVVGLAPTVLRGRTRSLLGVGALALALAGVSELVVLATAGVLSALVGAASSSSGTARRGGAGLTLAAPFFGAAGLAGAPTPATVFEVFLRIGSALFGSGYVLLSFLRSELVVKLGWLAEPQLLDAVAAGQVTPGPVFSTATFVGYVLAGAPGALAATAGIFLPAFVLVALSGRMVPRLRASRFAGAFLDGLNAASLALMVATMWTLGRASLVDPVSLALGATACVLLIRFRVGATRVVLGCGFAGVALMALGVMHG